MQEFVSMKLQTENQGEKQKKSNSFLLVFKHTIQNIEKEKNRITFFYFIQLKIVTV